MSVPRLLCIALATAFLDSFAYASPAPVHPIPRDDFTAPQIEERATAPKITLDNGVFTGVSSGGLNKFFSIPFAKPPVGDLRFRLPVTVPAYNGTYQATSFGPACFQQDITLPIVSGLVQETIDFITNTIYGAIFPDAEDCLTLNVWTPATATPSSKLPVIAWIFGGGFELGSPSMYDGSPIVSRSIEMGKPVVFVSMNYRVSGLGFLAGKEVKAAGVGNLGLHDQRESFRWIQKYITAFGGDPTKVTLHGESAGAISAGLHMITNGGNTEGLFRGAFMQSGSPIPVGDITKGQQYYDQIVANTGCSGSADTLACLRTVSYAKLGAAINKSPGLFSYQSLNLAWLPRVDGVFLTDTPYNLVGNGTVANIPFVTGDCDDEGTLFSLGSLNVTTDAQFKAYIKQTYLPTATDATITQLASVYPNDITQGSPFDTGIFNALTPQFKRIAAIQGDLVFQSPRRYFLQQRSSISKSWSFLYKRGKALPVLGTAHVTDLLNTFFVGGDLRDYLISFAATLDPNNAGISPSWPAWTNAKPQSLAMIDGLIPRVVVADTYRGDAMNLLIELSKASPL